MCCPPWLLGGEGWAARLAAFPALPGILPAPSPSLAPAPSPDLRADLRVPSSQFVRGAVSLLGRTDAALAERLRLGEADALFDAMDTDGSGELSLAELVEAFRATVMRGA